MSQAVLTKLLKYPHAAVFDTTPQAELALRLRNPRGLVWEIVDSTLKLAVGQSLIWDGAESFDGLYDWGLTRRQYSLLDKTVGDLADELRADGHEVVFENPDLAERGAHVLIPGSGDQAVSNGDHISGYTSLLWCVMGAYSIEIEAARHQVGQALRQMVMTQAEGEWLDVWANLYGVPRRSGETDAELQARILKEVFRLRVNGLALEQAVTDVVGESVTIDEPWKRMFRTSQSALSGVDHLQDGRYYTYHVIQPVGAEGTDWSLVLPVLERNKAAGIEIAAPRVDFPAREVILQPPVEYRIERSLVEYRGSGIYGTQDQILGVMRLSDNEITINHQVARSDLIMLSESDGMQTAQQIEPHRTIVMANVILSDGDALGEENVILSRGASRVDFDPEPIPSDQMMLSNYSATTVVELVERITLAEHAYDAASTFTAAGELGHIDTRAFVTDEEAYLLPTWVGGWGAVQWLPDWRYAGMTRTDTPA